jgi:hypothetical protein
MLVSIGDIDSRLNTNVIVRNDCELLGLNDIISRRSRRIGNNR